MLVATAVLIAYPVAIMIMNAFKERTAITDSPLALPTGLDLSNFVRAWQEASFGTYATNSVIVTVCSVVATIFVASMASFVLARTDHPVADALGLVFLLGLLLPVRLAIVPLFIVLRSLGLLDTLAGLVLVYVASNIPFAIFVLTSFIRSIPREIDDAARLDGASEFTIYRRLILPLARPGLAVVAIYNIVLVWNDFFFPLVFIHTPSLNTLPLGIANFVGQYQTEWDLIFAGLVMSAIPTAAAFLLISRPLISGLRSGILR